MQDFIFSYNDQATQISVGWWEMPFIPWGGEHLLCDQVTVLSGHHPCGGMWWWGILFQACETPALPLAVRLCEQCCITQGVLGVTAVMVLGRMGWAGLGEASYFIYGFVLFSVMAAARPQLLYLCISTPVTGISHSVCACLLGVGGGGRGRRTGLVPAQDQGHCHAGEEWDKRKKCYKTYILKIFFLDWALACSYIHLTVFQRYCIVSSENLFYSVSVG